jgi:hypothetical protein
MKLEEAALFRIAVIRIQGSNLVVFCNQIALGIMSA